MHAPPVLVSNVICNGNFRYRIDPHCIEVSRPIFAHDPCRWPTTELNDRDGSEPQMRSFHRLDQLHLAVGALLLQIRPKNIDTQEFEGRAELVLRALTDDVLRRHVRIYGEVWQIMRTRTRD
jgi:hypothetical protein